MDEVKRMDIASEGNPDVESSISRSYSWRHSKGMAYGLMLLGVTVVASITIIANSQRSSTVTVAGAQSVTASSVADDSGSPNEVRLSEPIDYPEQAIRLRPAPADAKPTVSAEEALAVDQSLGIFAPAALAAAERSVVLATYSNDQFREIGQEPTFQDVLAWVVTYHGVRLEGGGHGGSLTSREPADGAPSSRTCTILSPVDATQGTSLNVASTCYLTLVESRAAP